MNIFGFFMNVLHFTQYEYEHSLHKKIASSKVKVSWDVNTFRSGFCLHVGQFNELVGQMSVNDRYFKA